MMSGIGEQPIDCGALLASVADVRAGATVTFAGVVRDHDQGRAIAGIDYVCHPSAAAVLAEVVGEYSGQDGVHGIAAWHRVGALTVGEVVLYVAVSASHRAQAFTCASGLVDRIKAVLPVWKKQYFAAGGHEWAGCP